jgi:hypothetical protein
MLMLIFCERKTLLNGWLILADKLKRTGPVWTCVMNLVKLIKAYEVISRLVHLVVSYVVI